MNEWPDPTYFLLHIQNLAKEKNLEVVKVDSFEVYIVDHDSGFSTPTMSLEKAAKYIQERKGY